jgi:hypothetical protein
MSSDTPDTTENTELDEALRKVEEIVEGVYSDPQYDPKLDPHDLAGWGLLTGSPNYSYGNYGRIILLDWSRHEYALLDFVQDGQLDLPEDRASQIESLSDLTPAELEALKITFTDKSDGFSIYDHHLLYKITDSKGRSVWYSLLLDGDIGFVDYSFDGDFYTSEKKFLQSFQNVVDAGQEISDWEV